MTISFRSRLRGALAVTLSATLLAGPSYGHNRIVHQDMVDLAYEIMRLVESGASFSPAGAAGLPTPGTQPEWNAFLSSAAAAAAKLRAQNSGLSPAKTLICSQVVGATNTMNAGWAENTLSTVQHPVSIDYITGSDCGVRFNWTPGGIYNSSNSGDHTGLVLGLWAAHIDELEDNTHLWVRPTNALGLGALKDFLDHAIDQGLEVILLPFVCLADCIFGDCSDCSGDTKDIADGANPIDDLEGLLPGVGDITGSDWVGMWHHIKLAGSASNEFDNHQGLLFDEAGPGGPPDPLDLLLVAIFDASGLSVHHDESNGVKNYQISSGGDFHPDTVMRSKSQWQFTSIAHTPFEPVDNLAHFGWNKFRTEAGHPVSGLGWPLHALGDATVPMHVAGTPAWGHRPFEDAQENIWPDIRLVNASDSAQMSQASRILQRAFEWRKFIQDWRAAHPGNSTNAPVRELVTELGKRTATYAMNQMPAKAWPYNPGVSTLYLTSQGLATEFYSGRPDAVSLVQPLIEDGVGAMLALLISAAEVL